MTIQSTELSWRDGDVYFWRYRDESGELRYHCRAQKAIVIGDYLNDIYWAYIDSHIVNISGVTGGRWTQKQSEKHLSLDYKGNLDEFDAIADYNEPLYAEADILDLRHSNSSQKQIYLRKGAVRSKERMLEHCWYLREKAESELRSAQRDVQRYAGIEARIEAGADLKEIYL